MNAAGSQFALALGLCAGLAATRGAARVIWMLAVPLLVAAVWLSASRAAFVAIAVVLLAVVVRTVMASVGSKRWVGAVAGVAAAIAILVAAPRMNIDNDTRRAMSFRIGITQTSLRMAQTHPLFGIGIGQLLSEFRSVQLAGPPEPLSARKRAQQLSPGARGTGSRGTCVFRVVAGRGVRADDPRAREGAVG